MDLVEKTKNPNRHPWEMSRSDRILKLIDTSTKDIVIADVGSGDQYFSSKLTEYTNFDVIAVDKEYSKDKPHHKRIKCLDKISLLKNNSVDYIFLMDVLEHIEDDYEFLKELTLKLKNEGKIIITVPAWQALYSKHDIYLKHFRRYNYKELNNLIIKTNLNIEKGHYFYSILLPFRIISLIMEKIFTEPSNSQKGIGQWKFSKNNYITLLMYNLLNIDFQINHLLNQINIRLPGLSLLMVVSKKM